MIQHEQNVTIGKGKTWLDHDLSGVVTQISLNFDGVEMYVGPFLSDDQQHQLIFVPENFDCILCIGISPFSFQET